MSRKCDVTLENTRCSHKSRRLSRELLPPRPIEPGSLQIHYCPRRPVADNVEEMIDNYDDGDEELVAAWEALLLPDWRWEALEKEDDGLYYGRVKSPKTYGKWEYGHFTQEQLEEAGAYRVDADIDDNEPVFPDGGYPLAQDLYDAPWLDRYDDIEGVYQSTE